MNTEIERPKFVKDHHLEFLDDLRNSSVTNMVFAKPYLLLYDESLTDAAAEGILSYWMRTFAKRQLVLVGGEKYEPV